MLRFTLIALLTAALTACSPARDDAARTDAAPVSNGQPLFAGLGPIAFPITTRSEKAQAYFNQGLALTWGFNHAAADFAFTEATVHDPDCAMCYWGSALVLGPNINAPMAAQNAPRAHVLATRAAELAGNTSQLEQDLIAALHNRYEPVAPEDRSHLDQAWAEAMRALADKYPDNPHVVTLKAEALMDLHPWDFWLPDGSARPWTGEVTATIEHALELDPDHVGAIHLYIHTMEQSQMADRAEPHADRLAQLAPAAGHLVHMPAHIYMRVGRYIDATLTNMKATEADNQFVSVCKSNSPIYLAGYVPHNWHFGWVSAATAGWSESALEMARGTAAALSPQLVRDPGMGAIAQHFLMQPAMAHVRFGQWDAIRALPEPDDDLLYARGIWHYAQARALTARGDLAAAANHAAALDNIRNLDALKSMSFFSRDGAVPMLAIASAVLDGEMALARNQLDSALASLTHAVELEDALAYTEPPDWYYPARHSLGVVQLAMGDAEGAEETYLEDLYIMPENGWALLGLSQALQAQGRTDEAAEARRRFETAFARADVEITSSRL